MKLLVDELTRGLGWGFGLNRPKVRMRNDLIFDVNHDVIEVGILRSSFNYPWAGNDSEFLGILIAPRPDSTAVWNLILQQQRLLISLKDGLRRKLPPFCQP